MSGVEEKRAAFDFWTLESGLCMGTPTRSAGVIPVRPSPRAAEVDGAGGGASCGMSRLAAVGAEEREGGRLAVTAHKAVGKASAAVEEDASSLSWVLCSSPVAVAILKAAHRMQDYVTVARLACACRALRETVREHADVLSSYSVQGEVLLNDRFGINGAVQPGKAGGYLLAAMEETRMETPGIWDLRVKRRVGLLRGHSRDVTCLTWSPSGRFVASGSFDATVRVWDAHKRDCVHVFNGHSEGVLCVAWAADSSFLVSGSEDGMTRIWCFEDASCVMVIGAHPRQKLDADDAVSATAISPDGMRVAIGCGDGSLWVHDTRTGNVLHKFLTGSLLDGIDTVAFSRHKDQLVCATRDGKLRLCTLEGEKDQETAPISATLNAPEGARRLCISDDGAHVALQFDSGNHRVIPVLDTRTGDMLSKVLPGESGDVFLLGWNDGQLLVHRHHTKGLSSIRHFDSICALEWNAHRVGSTSINRKRALE